MLNLLAGLRIGRGIGNRNGRNGRPYYARVSLTTRPQLKAKQNEALEALIENAVGREEGKTNDRTPLRPKAALLPLGLGSRSPDHRRS